MKYYAYNSFIMYKGQHIEFTLTIEHELWRKTETLLAESELKWVSIMVAVKVKNLFKL